MSLDQTAPGAIPAPPPIHSDGPHPDMQVAMAELHLRQLAEMREIGMRHLRDTEIVIQRDGRDPPSRPAKWAAFDSMSKSVRQIMALEEHIIGLREKRITFVKTEWMKQKAGTVRASVERSLNKAEPGPDRPRQERLLADLFVDYRKFADGNIREMIEGICKTLGITADLSLWDEPQPGADITLRNGFDWVLPANGDKPYTVLPFGDGRTRVPFDSDYRPLREWSARPGVSGWFAVFGFLQFACLIHTIGLPSSRGRLLAHAISYRHSREPEDT